MVPDSDNSEFRLTSGPATNLWKQGVDPFLADLSLVLACNAEPTFHMLNAIRDGDIVISPTNIPNLNDWFSYYKNHKKLFSDCVSALAHSFSWGKEKRQFGFKDLFSESGPVPKGSGIEGVIETITPIRDFELDWKSSPPSLLFAILIWVPCNSLYGEHPPAMLHRARHGDLTALRKLIQLDKSIIQEPKIARKMQQWQAKGRLDIIADIGSYLGESISEISLQQVKLTWSRFIQDTSIRDGKKLSAPIIQSLFNAIAQDSGIGLQDPDIGGMSPEAFAKALKRREDFWQLSPSR